MRITDTLKQEHRVIEQVLDALEKLTSRARADGCFDRHSAGDIVRFMQQFADAWHHGKEEGLLFPALVAKGIPGDAGPIGVMQAEHEFGRAAVRKMEAALWEPMEDKQAVERFLDHAEQFVDHLRAHIQKEDHILFPMADSVLTTADHVSLLGDTERSDQEGQGLATEELYVALANQLADRFGVRRACDRHEGVFTGCFGSGSGRAST